MPNLDVLAPGSQEERSPAVVPSSKRQEMLALLVPGQGVLILIECLLGRMIAMLCAERAGVLIIIENLLSRPIAMLCVERPGRCTVGDAGAHRQGCLSHRVKGLSAGGCG